MKGCTRVPVRLKNSWIYFSIMFEEQLDLVWSRRRISVQQGWRVLFQKGHLCFLIFKEQHKSKKKWDYCITIHHALKNTEALRSLCVQGQSFRISAMASRWRRQQFRIPHCNDFFLCWISSFYSLFGPSGHLLTEDLGSPLIVDLSVTIRTNIRQDFIGGLWIINPIPQTSYNSQPATCQPKNKVFCKGGFWNYETTTNGPLIF